MKTIMVAGSAHLDILARSIHRDDALDRIGDVAIEVGGTACNIAINLVASDVQVQLLSAMNTSPYSKIIADYLTQMGVTPMIQYMDSLPTAGFSAHIDTHGEMVSAVSAMPVERAIFTPEIIEQAMDGAMAVIIECNLSVQSLNSILSAANERDLPVYVAAVSEEKSARIAFLSGRIKGVFLNVKEFEAFCQVILGGASTPLKVAHILGTTLVLTDGSKGTTIAQQDGTTSHIPPPLIEKTGSRLGMGDALVAGIVLQHELNGLPFKDAATKALKIVSRVGASPHCHPGQRGSFETAIDQYQHDAGHDPMTGLLNRQRTEEALSHAIERRTHGKPRDLSVLMVDIDHFKAINDTYGHNVGDLVIADVTKTMKGCLRETDYLGRWGGEEFVFILPNTTRSDAMIVAERIRASVEEKVREPRAITVSVGCVGISQETMNMRTPLLVVESADKALYEAKRAGRNRVICAS